MSALTHEEVVRRARFRACFRCLLRGDTRPTVGAAFVMPGRCCVCGLEAEHTTRVDGPTADRAHHALCDELATAADGGGS